MKIFSKYLVLLALTFFGCSSPERSVEGELEKQSSNVECFDQILEPVGSSIQYGDTYIKTSPLGNFFKFISMHDSKIQFSCGRGAMEHILDTVSCENLSELPSIKFENDELIILTKNGGSNNWLDMLIPLREDGLSNIKLMKALYVDTVDLRVVELINKENDYFFNVYSYPFQSNLFVKSNYSKIREGKGGDPSFHVENVYLKDSLLIYSVNLEESLIIDTLVLTNRNTE